MSFRLYSKEFTLGNSVAELSLGLGANEGLLVSSATVCNTDSVTRLLTLHLASTGAAAATGNKIENVRTLPTAQATNTALSGKTLVPGAKVYAGSDAVSVAIMSITGTIVPQNP
jgi:uncharacterized protein YfiM (DUF2279 family)